MSKAKVIGVFKVTDDNEYKILDPLDMSIKDLEVTDVDSDPAKLVNGKLVRLVGTYEVTRVNELFSKLMVGDQMVSIPNHKLDEEEDK